MFYYEMKLITLDKGYPEYVYHIYNRRSGEHIATTYHIRETENIVNLLNKNLTPA